MSSFQKKSRRLNNSTRSSLPRQRLGTRHKLKNSARSFAKRALPLQKAKGGEESSKTVCENNCRLVKSFASFCRKPVAQQSCFALRDAGKWQIQSPHYRQSSLLRSHRACWGTAIWNISFQHFI